MNTPALSPLISVNDLQQLMEKDQNLAIVDVRYDLMNSSYGDKAYFESRIKGALRIDLGMDLCTEITEHTGRHPLKEVAELEALMQDLGINNDTRIVIYDDNGGMFAIHLWWVFHWLGQTNVQVLEGGLNAWLKAGLPMVTSVPFMDQSIGQFKAAPDTTMTVLADAILLDIQSQSHQLCVVDARGEARYRGEVEPLDPVAGHIPNAINRPFEQNLNPDGTFKSPEILKAEWLDFLAQHPNQIIVHQCGSGVSACHNIFAMYYAGLGMTKLYPGSWSEWCKDPNKPVAKA